MSVEIVEDLHRHVERIEDVLHFRGIGFSLRIVGHERFEELRERRGELLENEFDLQPELVGLLFVAIAFEERMSGFQHSVDRLEGVAGVHWLLELADHRVQQARPLLRKVTVADHRDGVGQLLLNMCRRTGHQVDDVFFDVIAISERDEIGRRGRGVERRPIAFDEVLEGDHRGSTNVIGGR